MMAAMKIFRMLFFTLQISVFHQIMVNTYCVNLKTIKPNLDRITEILKKASTTIHYVNGFIYQFLKIKKIRFN